MDINKYIKYFLLGLPCILLGTVWGCSSNDKDYLDDGAYPPPTMEILSESFIESAILDSKELVMGTVSAPNSLRDIYATLMAKDGDDYIEIDKDRRVAYQLDEFPKDLEFTLEVPIVSEDVAGIKIVATDIYTKSTETIIQIDRIKGIPPMITFEEEDLGKVQFNSTVKLSAHVEGKIGLKSVKYVLAQNLPYKELGEPIILEASGEKTQDFELEVLVDNEDANSIAVTAIDKDGFERREFVTFSIDGIPEGRAAIFREQIMATEWEIPVEANKPYIFSLEGVDVNGDNKHIISLDEAKKAGDKASVDFMFANIWRNPNGGRLGNHGFAYVGAARIDGGAVGRKPDVDEWLNKSQRNEVYFEVIDQQLVNDYKLDEFFKTTTGNWKTFETLNLMKNLVKVSGSNRQIYQRTNAGTAGGAVVQQIKDGSYIAILRVANDKSTYGIIKVVKAADDSDALLPSGKLAFPEIKDTPVPCNGPNLGYDYKGVASLYGRTCEIEIIIQL